MSSASAPAPVLRPALQAIVGALTWKRAASRRVLALLIAALLNPVFSVPFWVLLGRMMFIAALLLVTFAVAGTWHPSRIAALAGAGAGGGDRRAGRDAAGLPAEHRRQPRQPAAATKAG